MGLFGHFFSPLSFLSSYSLSLGDGVYRLKYYLKGPLSPKQPTNQPVWEIAVLLAVAGDVYDGVFSCCPFSYVMPWMRSWNLLSQCLRFFLPTLKAKASCALD